MENALSGTPEVIGLDGEPGIGKTSLLLAASDHARAEGFTVLSARAARLEREFSFGIVRQLLEQVLFSATPGMRKVLLAGPAAHAAPILESPPSPAGAGSRLADVHATFHALWWLLANLAKVAPVLVTVDDLHSADVQSAQWLSYVGRRLGHHRIAVLTTMSAGASDDQPSGHLTAPSPVRRVPVKGLDVSATAELIAGAFAGRVDDAFVMACHTVTGGNPALLVELLHSVDTAEAAPDLDRFGPHELAAAVNARLRSEDPALAALARVVAALGDTSVDIELAAAVAELALPEASRAAERLTQLNLLDAGPSLRFRHSIVQAAVESQLAPVDRNLAHASAARVLHERQASPERVAAHLMETSRMGEDWLIQVLRTAARRAMSEGAPVTAVAYLRRLLREPLTEDRRRHVLFELGSTEIHVDPPAAVRHLTSIAGDVTEPRQQARISGALAQALGENDRYREAVDVLDQAIARVDPHDPELAFDLEAQLVSLARHEQHTAGVIRDRMQRLQRRQAGSVPARRSVDALGAERASTLDLRPAVTRRLAMAAMHVGPVRRMEELRTFSNVLAALIHIEEFDLATHLCEEILGDRSRRSLPIAYALAASFRAEVRCQLGQLLPARADAENTIDRLDVLAVRRGILPTLVESTLTDAIVDLGDVDAAAALLRKYATAPLPPFLRTNFLLHSRGALHAAAGDHRAALADQLECARRLEHWDAVDHPHLTWRRRAALSHAAIGDHQDAVMLAEEDLKVARKRELPRSLGIALRVAGTLHENEYGTALLAEAVTVLGTTKAVLEHARAQAGLGLRLSVGRRRHEAATLLHEALATAESCAAAPLATVVRAALDSTDADLGHRASSLTRREQGVALLAAQGRSNPEIAAALVLTRRTVEFHLTNVYRKLGISRRSQLSTVLTGREP